MCLTDCWWGQTFVRLEPPLDEDGTLVLTVKADWIDETCSVTLPLPEPVIGCSGASGLEARRGGVVLFDRSDPVTVKTEGAECGCLVGRATISTQQ